VTNDPKRRAPMPQNLAAAIELLVTGVYGRCARTGSAGPAEHTARRGTVRAEGKVEGKTE